jgi:hypothetical protein
MYKENKVCTIPAENFGNSVNLVPSVNENNTAISTTNTVQPTSENINTYILLESSSHHSPSYSRKWFENIFFIIQ